MHNMHNNSTIPVNDQTNNIQGDQINNIQDNQINQSHKILSFFGKLITKPVMNDIFNGFNLTKDESKKIISDTVVAVLTDQTESISILMIDNAIRQYSFNDFDILTLLEMIYQFISTSAKKIADKIQNNLNKKKFTIESFIEIRKKYFKNVSKLGYIMNSFVDVVSIKNAHIFKIISDYVFYEQIINKVYHYDNLDLQLFAMLMEVMDKKNRIHILTVFNTINNYNGFSYSINDKSKRNEIFNASIDTDTNKTFLNPTMTEEFVDNIDTKIRKLCSCNGTFQNDSNNDAHNDNGSDDISIIIHQNDSQDTTQSYRYEQLINEITNDIHMCMRIADPVVFMMKYYQALQKRLLCTDIYVLELALEVETTLGQLLNSKESPELYMKIMSVINDMRAFDVVNSEFRNVSVKFESDKYPKEFQDSYDCNITGFTVLRKNIWTEIKDKLLDDVDRINEPLMIKNYLNLFSDFYNKYFKNVLSKDHPNGYACRKLKYNYTNSVVEYAFELGDRKYVIKSTIVQGCILENINGCDRISAEDLSIKMNMKLKDMTNELNTLLMAKLILRDVSGDASNIKLDLYMNPDFVSDSPSINLIALWIAVL